MRKKTNLWALFALCTLLFAGTIPVKAQEPSVNPLVKTFYDIENPHAALWTTDITVSINNLDLEIPGITLEFLSGRTDGGIHFDLAKTTLETADFTAPEGGDTTFVVTLTAKNTLPFSLDEIKDTVVVKHSGDRIGYIVFHYSVYCSGVSVPDTFSIFANGVKITEGMEFSEPLYLCYSRYGSALRLKYTKNGNEPKFNGSALSIACTGYNPDMIEDLEIANTTTIKVKAFNGNYNPSDDGICPSSTKTFVFTKVTPPPSVEPKIEMRLLLENYHADLWKDTITVDIKNLDAATQNINLNFIPGSGDPQFEITSNTTLQAADFSASTGNATFKVALKAKSTLEASAVRKNDTIAVSNGSERIGYVVLSYTVYCSSAERLQDTFGIYATLGTSERTYTKTGFEFTNEFYPGFDRNMNSSYRARYTSDGSEPSFASFQMCYNYCEAGQEGVASFNTTTTIKVKTFYDNSNPSTGVCPSPTKTFVFTKAGATEPAEEPAVFATETFEDIEITTGTTWTENITTTIKSQDLSDGNITLEVVPGTGAAASFTLGKNTYNETDFTIGTNDTTFTVGITAQPTLAQTLQDEYHIDTIIVKANNLRIGHIVVKIRVYCSGKSKFPAGSFTVNPADKTNFIGRTTFTVALDSAWSVVRVKSTFDGSVPTGANGDNIFAAGMPVNATTTVKTRVFYAGANLYRYPETATFCPSDIKTAVYTKVAPTPVDVPYASGLVTRDSLKLEKGFVYGGSKINSYATTRRQGVNIVDDPIGIKMHSLNIGVRIGHTSDYVILHYGEDAGKVSFRVLGEGDGDVAGVVSLSTVGAYESVNGYEWTKIGNVKLNGSLDTIDAVFDLARNSRYVRFNIDTFYAKNGATEYTDPDKVNSYFGFGNIGLEEAREQAAEVVLTPAVTDFEDSVYVKFTCATPDAEIHVYKETTDEITYEPVFTKLGVYVNNDSIKLIESTIIIAKAVAVGKDTSVETRVTYNRTDIVTTPVISVLGSWPYINYLYVAMSSTTEGAKIYYTLNGNTPDETSTLYTNGPVKINITGGGMSIKARAYKDGDVPSNVRTWSDELYIVYPQELPYNSGVIDRSTITGTNSGQAGFVSSTHGQKVDYAPEIGNAEFRTASHFIIFHYDGDAGELDFKTQGYNPDSALLGVWTSVNGNDSWIMLDSFIVDGVDAVTHNTTLPDSARFVKFQSIKHNGRYVLGQINVAKKEVVGNESFDAASASGLKVYPNPTNGEFSVQVANPSVITIFNASGVKVGSLNIDGNATVRSLGSGLYLLRAVDANGNISTERVVVK